MAMVLLNKHGETEQSKPQSFNLASVMPQTSSTWVTQDCLALLNTFAVSISVSFCANNSDDVYSPSESCLALKGIQDNLGLGFV